jgi:Leucine-rich repeat (LRR) protein
MKKRSFNHLRTLENLKIPSEGLLELFLIENKLKNGAKPSKMAENAENCDEMSENSDKMSENGGKMAENDGKMAENDGKMAEKMAENDLKNTENGTKNTENGLKNTENGPQNPENASENAFFAQFPSLELIEMGSNRLRKSPDFNSKLCPNLAEIYLGRNKLTEFPDFGELKNLRILALQVRIMVF